MAVDFVLTIVVLGAVAVAIAWYLINRRSYRLDGIATEDPAHIYAMALHHGILSYVTLGYSEDLHVCIFFGMPDGGKPKAVHMGDQVETILMYQSILKAVRSFKCQTLPHSRENQDSFLINTQRLLAEKGLTQKS